MSIRIAPLDNPLPEEAYTVLTHAYSGNPAHVRLFGVDNLISNDRLFRTIMAQNGTCLFGAWEGEKLVGLVGIEAHPLLDSDGDDAPVLTAETLRTSEATIDMLRERQQVWEAMEPATPHSHFGPVAVLPEYQHRGVGGRLMAHCCALLDGEGASGYLETEGEDNLRFYSRFGFRLLQKRVLFGIANYFMERPAAGGKEKP